MENFSENRESMVYEQIKARGIYDDKLLKTLIKIPRHLFVSPGIKERAYSDEALPIDEGQTISQPYIVAYMTDKLNLTLNDIVLEIGTGSGYQTAILAELAKKVYTLEIHTALQQKAKTILDDLGYKNIVYKTGDGYLGWTEYAPFNKIIVTAAPGSVPHILIDQLADPGIIILPVGRMFQNLILVEKEEGKTAEKRLIGVRFVPMIHSGD